MRQFWILEGAMMWSILYFMKICAADAQTAWLLLASNRPHEEVKEGLFSLHILYKSLTNPLRRTPQMTSMQNLTIVLHAFTKTTSYVSIVIFRLVIKTLRRPQIYDECMLKEALVE